MVKLLSIFPFDQGVSRDFFKKDIEILQSHGFNAVYSKANLSKAIDKIHYKETTIACVPLKHLPIKMVDGIVIAGLSARIDPSVVLIHENSEGNPFSALDNGKKIKTSSELLRQQFKTVKPSLDVELINSSKIPFIPAKEGGDFMLLEGDTVDINKLPKELALKKVQTTELVPRPGTGVFAYLCRMDDVITRRAIKLLHQDDVSKCTNVERKLLSKFPVEKRHNLACCVQLDANKSYHCSVAYWDADKKQISKGTYSQSTNFGLAEKLYQEIQANL